MYVNKSLLASRCFVRFWKLANVRWPGDYLFTEAHSGSLYIQILDVTVRTENSVFIIMKYQRYSVFIKKQESWFYFGEQKSAHHFYKQRKLQRGPTRNSPDCHQLSNNYLRYLFFDEDCNCSIFIHGSEWKDQNWRFCAGEMYKPLCGRIRLPFFRSHDLCAEHADFFYLLWKSSYIAWWFDRLHEENSEIITYR